MKFLRTASTGRLLALLAGLVIAIMLGTGYFALQFRERALEVAERELNNTALLLSRHFDQQLSDLQHVHDDVVSYMRADQVATSDEFEKKMSTLSAHEMLRAANARSASGKAVYHLEIGQPDTSAPAAQVVSPARTRDGPIACLLQRPSRRGCHDLPCWCWVSPR